MQKVGNENDKNKKSGQMTSTERASNSTNSQSSSAQPPKKSILTFKTILAFIGLVIVCGLVWLLYTITNTADTPQHSKNTQAPADTVNTKLDSAQPAAPQPNNTAISTTHGFVTGLENLPNSLKGTEVDGEIIIDGNSQLVVTNGLRRLFDYFLTTQGEEDLATIIERIEAYISQRTPEPARSQAIGILHQYLNYLKATTHINEAGGKPADEINIDDIAEQKKSLKNLRKQFFDAATITAFFGDEETYDDFNLSLLKIERDQGKSAAQKQISRQQLIDELPEGTTKQQILQQQTLVDLQTQTLKLKKEGATDEELFVMRAKLVGIEAAERLAQLDTKQRTWQTRIAHYLSAREQILTHYPDAQTRQLKIQELRDRNFSSQEQLRLKAFEDAGVANLDNLR